MESHIQQLLTQFQERLKLIKDLKELDELRIAFLGKKGSIQELMLQLKNVDKQQRPQMGKFINDLKERVTEDLKQRQEELADIELTQRLATEEIDISLPGRASFLGRMHPISQMLDRIIDVLVSMGFSVQDGPVIESDFYNFEALNFLPDHPARDMQDTFYLESGLLLRTHTSNTEVRSMEKSKPPIRIISAGKCFRNEDVSARSHVVFHQVEALYIDKGVTFTDLFATFKSFVSKLFNSSSIELRIRPSYFPFVEPGMEIDISCLICSGKGCNICKHTGWLEIAGAGMTHPNVLKSGNIDPEIYSGFAWGLGVERLIMIEHQIKDIRLFLENDMRFLKQFASSNI